MAIRFQCSGCSQPIEVDDEWASRAVVCPYCRRTVTAPFSSTLDDPSSLPSARSFDPGQHPHDLADATPPPTAPPAHAGRNTLAVVAAILMGLVLIQLFAASAIARANAEELDEIHRHIEERTEQGMDPFSATQKAMAELTEQSGGTLPDWYLGMGVLVFGAGLVWILAIICAGIAVSRPARRRLAAWTLVVGCLAPFYFCCMGGLL